MSKISIFLGSWLVLNVVLAILLLRRSPGFRKRLFRWMYNVKSSEPVRYREQSGDR